MELQNPISCGFWSSSITNLLLQLLVVVAMNLSIDHASAANQFRNETDRLALLQFKHQITNDPFGVLNSWNHSQHHCQWQGVTCGTRHQRVTAVNLTGQSLFGTISPHIGNLSFLRFIQLGENQFHGEIPQEIGRLVRLRYLSLTSNTLSREIPVNISLCSEIRVIDLLRNKLEGKIPSELGSLKKLEKLYLGANNLTGEIPSSIGNLSSLTELSLTYNRLEGILPKQMEFLTSLTKLGVSKNKLSGVIPAFLYNISTFVIISLSANLFHGNLPTNIGHKLTNLQQLLIGENNLTGNIPISITNASALEIFDFPMNKFEGRVPTNLGDLQRLKRINIGGNLLGTNSTRDLGFIASMTNCSNLKILFLGGNIFGGEIPKAMANLSLQLSEFSISENRLSGTIPEGVGNLVNLFEFDVAENSLSGVVPSDIGKLRKLQYLGLGANKFSGRILSILCNISSLFQLDLSDNRFEGNIFGNVFMNSQNLQEIDISQNNFSGVISPLFFNMTSSLVNMNLGQNRLSGSLPVEVGNLLHLGILDISYNNFSGEIPTTIVDCSSLENLYMQGNFFHGSIPRLLASLKSIQELDFSSNNLTGQIPRDLEKLQFLRYLNLSFNDLEGEIPTTGIFRNPSQISLIGNKKLCGGIPELNFPSCPMIKGKNKAKLKLVIVLSTVLPMTILLLGILLFYYGVNKQRDRREDSFSGVPTRANKILRLSYHDLHRATAGFSPENLIGSGSFGAVYKGKLDQHGNKLVAIKVLDHQKNGASKSFKAECTVLRNIRHRNLVSILSYCSSIDYRDNEFKALVYEFIENGNLDLWLHPEIVDQATRSANLDLSQRLNISMDVAAALQYLHNDCETTVVHCDIKPSNILLDNDLVAHVGDFGLARLLPRTVSSSSEQGTSSTIAMKGSIGYAAPEYGMGLAASTQGDVYSYGILLLEMITGRRPTDDMLTDGLDLYSYVNMALPKEVFKIVDPLLLATGDEIGKMAAGEQIINGERKMECLVSLLKIGLKCSARLPNDRMHMNEVTRQLHLIKDVFLGL